MYGIKIFNNSEFGKIRTVVIDGEPWFLAMDISDRLGYAQTANMLKQVCTEDKKKVPPSDLDDTFSKFSSGVSVINESGLYDAIFGSKLKNAKNFRRWVTSEVLPEIRKTGTYGLPQMPKDPMELLELHYQALKQVDSKVNTLEQRFDNFEKSLPLLPNEADEVSGAVKKRVVEVLGGKESNAYRNRGMCQRTFMDAYRELKRNFNVGRYKDIKREQKAQAVAVASRYEPPLFLKKQIEQENAQITMDTVS